jgi:hypothetical protein
MKALVGQVLWADLMFLLDQSVRMVNSVKPRRDSADSCLKLLIHDKKFNFKRRNEMAAKGKVLIRVYGFKEYMALFLEQKMCFLIRILDMDSDMPDGYGWRDI